MQESWPRVDSLLVRWSTSRLSSRSCPGEFCPVCPVCLCNSSTASCSPCLTANSSAGDRLISTINDPYKQVQYSNVLKTLQEEQRLLQDMEAALDEIKNGPSTSGRASMVCDHAKLSVAILHMYYSQSLPASPRGRLSSLSRAVQQQPIATSTEQ